MSFWLHATQMRATNLIGSELQSDALPAAILLRSVLMIVIRLSSAAHCPKPIIITYHKPDPNLQPDPDPNKRRDPDPDGCIETHIPHPSTQ